MSSYTLSRYLVAAEAVNERGQTLVYSTRTTKRHLLSADLWKYLQEGWIDAVPENLQESLARKQLLVKTGTDELAEILAENRSASDSTSSMLYEVIQPSALCQMGCYYCGQEHRAKWISPEHALKITDGILSKLINNNYRKLYIGWFGAEPLTGLKQMQMISGLLKDYCLDNNIEFGGKIVTNGLNLVPSNFKTLTEELNIDFFEITLDGTEEEHDKHRFLKTGGGTFKKIYRNLQDFVAYKERTNGKFTISVRCNVDQNNDASVNELIDKLHADGLLGKIKFYPTGIYAWGENKNDQKLDKTGYADREIAWIKKLAGLGVNVRGFLMPRRVKITCLATKRNASVYDAYGQVFSCTEVPYTANTKDSAYFSGTLDEGTERRSHQFWYDRIEQDNALPCHTCPMLPVCGGGCPKQWEDGEIPCPSFKFNFEKKLRYYYEMYAQPKSQPETAEVAA